MKSFDYLKKFLEEEGYKYEIEGKTIAFKFQGCYFLAMDNNDTFLQIIISVDLGSVPRNDVMEVCNQLNYEYNAIKFIVWEKYIWVSYEFEPTQYTTHEQFESILTMLDTASDELISKFQ